MIPKYQPTFSFAEALDVDTLRDAPGALVNELAALFGSRHVFLFRSGRDALFTLMKSLGTGGEAVLPAYNCIAVPDAVAAAGWRPRLADVAPCSVNMTSREVADACTPQTRVVIMTHQFGIPADVEGIMEFCRQRGIYVVEDAAAAFGARYKGRPVGSFGDAAILSFHMTKVVNGGRAGALLTSDEQIARTVRNHAQRHSGFLEELADRGRALVWAAATQQTVYGIARHLRSCLVKDRLYEGVEPGSTPVASTTGCSSYVAALVHRQIQALQRNLQARCNSASIYDQVLRGLPTAQTCSVDKDATPAWIQYPVFVRDKADCYRYFLKHGVDLSWTFKYSCGRSYGSSNTANSDFAARSVLGLPTYPGLRPGESQRICELLQKYFK